MPAHNATQHSPIRVSAPGSIMLLGEHAVLHGQPALACAVNALMHVTLTPRDDDALMIRSNLANYQSRLSLFEADEKEPRLSFVLAAIETFLPRLEFGFELVIESEFSDTIGLGSSAAVTAAVVGALMQYCEGRIEKRAVFDTALGVIHQVQNGRGSGTDLAASVYGSAVRYQMQTQDQPWHITPVPLCADLHLFYCGYKMKTPDVLALVEQKAHKQPDLYQGIYRLMGHVVDQALESIKQDDLQTLGELCNHYHGLMDALGVCDQTLAEMTYALRSTQGMVGAKISGSGLGDCVLGLSAPNTIKEVPNTLNQRAIAVSIHPQGLSYDVN